MHLTCIDMYKGNIAYIDMYKQMHCIETVRISVEAYVWTHVYSSAGCVNDLP